MAHKHQVKTSRTYGYTAPIVGAKYNARAHGGVCIVETCSCGAERRTNSTGGPSRTERGPWVTPDADELSYGMHAVD